MSNNPADIFNQALDAAGVDFVVGDPEEGTRPAQVLLRAYGQCLRQMLRAAHWSFARQQTDLQLIADATGQTAGLPTKVPAPWAYEYRYPVNCMKARFLPANYLNPNAAPAGNIALPNTPQTTVSQPPYAQGIRLQPSPFLIAFDPNAAITDLNSNWLEIQGESPEGSIVILTNTAQAQLVFTAFMRYPNVWDSQFRQAFVSFLAAQCALPLAKDKKFGLEMRDRNMAIAKEAVIAARVTNANESGFPQTTDHVPDWMRVRTSGGGWIGGPGGSGCGSWGGNGFGWGGAGFLGYGWDTSVF